MIRIELNSILRPLGNFGSGRHD